MIPATSALSAMKKIFVRAFFLVFLSLNIFLNPIFVDSVEADYLKVTSPANIYQSSEFEIEIEISDKPNTTLSLKARLGNTTNSLTKGQTLDPTSGVWLSDTVAWNRFPKVTTDTDGHWKGKLKAKPSQTTALGENFLVIRLGLNDKFYKDSDPYQITLVELPKAPEPPKVESVGKPILNEFLAAGGQEWVELKNIGTGPSDLSGWFIDDEDGKSTPFEIPSGTILAPNQYFVANFSSPKLNDLTDSVRLLKPDSSVVEEYRYSNPEKGKSFAKDSSGNWFIASETTPGGQNPNPPVVLSANTSKPEPINKISDQTPETNLTTNHVAQLPKLSTQSAQIATVSASFKDSSSGKNILTYLPLIAGGLLVLAALGIVGKNVYSTIKVRRNRIELDNKLE